MPSLAESQSILRHAIAGHDATEVPSMLTAPGGAASRFFIYRRHYRASLASHIRGRFPTVEWLLGSVRMLALAEQFACETPPSAPCMAEYGGDFVACLARSEALRELPYMDKVALLDWHLGDVAVAIDYPALAITGLRYREPDQLLDLLLALQPGVRYLDAGWPVDDLVRALRLAWPFTLGRDLALLAQGKRGHLRRLGWLYRYDPAPDFEAAGTLRAAER